MLPPAVGQALLDQSLVRKYPKGQSNGGNFSTEILFSKVTLVCMYKADKTNQTHRILLYIKRAFVLSASDLLKGSATQRPGPAVSGSPAASLMEACPRLRVLFVKQLQLT